MRSSPSGRDPLDKRAQAVLSERKQLRQRLALSLERQQRDVTVPSSRGKKQQVSGQQANAVQTQAASKRERIQQVGKTGGRGLCGGGEGEAERVARVDHAEGGWPESEASRCGREAKLV